MAGPMSMAGPRIIVSSGYVTDVSRKRTHSYHLNVANVEMSALSSHRADGSHGRSVSKRMLLVPNSRPMVSWEPSIGPPDNRRPFSARGLLPLRHWTM